MNKQFAQGQALIIGVGADLPNTVTDAQGVADILRDSGRCGYPAAQVTLLTEEAATREGVLAALDKLAASTTPDSTVIVYYSGHGYQVKSTMGKAYYLMTYGYDVEALYESAVSGQELVDKLRQIPAQKLLLLLDCCHAGGLDDVKTPGMTKAPLPPEAVSLLQQGTGRVAVASCKADELSYAGKPYSAFTLALIEALCGEGAAEQDGYVRVSDLALHTREKVPQRTSDKQHPILHFDQADNFVVAYYAAGDTAPKGVPFTVEPVIEPTPGAWSPPPSINYQAHLQGSGAIAQGTGAVAVGARGVQVGGSVGGSVVTGDHAVLTGGGDHIQVGDISGSSGVAIGRYASATGQQGVDPVALEKLFVPLLQAVVQAAPPEQKPAVAGKVQELKAEAAKGKEANDNRLATLVDGLLTLVPGAVSAVVSAFASPILGGIAGPATKWVLDKVQGNNG